MKDIEKLKELYDKIDNMLETRINPGTEEFIEWHTGMKRVLGRIYGKNSDEYSDFCNRLFHSMVYSAYSDGVKEDIRACHDSLVKTKAKIKVYISEFDDGECIDDEKINKKPDCNFKKIFIVHGHDEALREKMARLMEKQNIEAIILAEQPNKGMTIIEKIEAYAEEVPAAICLFTADDKMADGTMRARENVVLETGYFYGRLGRKNTIVVAEEMVMNISDLRGVIYVDSNNWEIDVLKELKQIGYDIDFNKIF